MAKQTLALPEGWITRRRQNWGQTAETHVPDPEAAASFIERVGIATLYPVSEEIPDLFHAYTGDAEAQTEAKWDSPSGHVYEWRWALGHRRAAFYSSLVRGRPTYVAWPLLPAVLRLFGEIDRAPEELFAAGALSPEAKRVAEALGGSAPLATGDLRKQAGFPTGKEQRAAYLKAVGELEERLLLAKVFSGVEGDTEMYHVLVAEQYPDAADAARQISREQAVDALLAAYLPQAVYALPKALARHLRLPEAEIRSGLERTTAADTARAWENGAAYLTTQLEEHDGWLELSPT